LDISALCPNCPETSAVDTKTLYQSVLGPQYLVASVNKWSKIFLTF